jgi:hypothetical protein
MGRLLMGVCYKYDTVKFPSLIGNILVDSVGL